MSRRALALALALAAGAAQAEEGAPTPPFITTPDEVVERMLELAGTGPGDLVVDLGSGDGRIVITAAQKYGARGLGIEFNERLVAKSRENARAAGVADRVAFVHGDVVVSDISVATVVTLYLLPSLIDRLQPRFIDELEPGTRIVSHAFRMVGWKPDRVETVRLSRPHPGQGDESTLYLWVVPADVRGKWRAADLEITIHQNYQELEVDGSLNGRALVGVPGTVSGRDVVWETRGARFRGSIEGARMVGDIMLDGRSEPLVLTRSR